ncbi:MAG: BON domain-containing protein [Anaerolineae bacterium]|nr:BON domain-containing protein [Anaerolineae bacterium]
MKSFDFKFGAVVNGRESQSPCGHLDRLAVEPESWCITDVIMESGLVFKQHTVIPVAEIEEATAVDIRVAVGCQELAGYPAFSEMVVERNEQSPGWMTPVQSGIVGATATAWAPTTAEMAVVQEKVRQGVADSKIVLNGKVAVYGSDGRIGQLSHLITVNDDMPHQIQYLVVSEGALFPRQTIVPIHYVQTLSEQGIHILASTAEMDDFPQFGAEMLEDIENRDSSGWWEVGEVEWDAIEEVVPVPEDAQLATAVETALMSDLRTETAVIDVINERGVITLTGKAPDWAVRQAAETIASHQPGVVKVINDLAVEQS